MKILILVISSIEEPYKKLENAIRETWGNNTNDDVKIFYNYGSDGSSTFIDDDRIICDCIENMDNIGLKTIKSFELLYDSFEFDYIFRTNLSSFVHIENMIKYLKDMPSERFYGGMCTLNFSGEHLQKFGEGTFASGSGYFLSKDIVKLLIDNKELWDHSIIDDVALAGLLKKLGILPTLCPRIDIINISNDKLILVDGRFKRGNYSYATKKWFWIEEFKCIIEGLEGDDELTWFDIEKSKK
jgi:hypothetical protein